LFNQAFNNKYTDLIINARTGSFTPPVRNYIAEFNFMKSSPDSVLLNNSILTRSSVTALLNTSITAWAYDSVNVKSYVRLHDDGKGASIRIYRNNLQSVQSITPPLTFMLYQNYPNPFNPSTEIKFTIPERAIVTLKVYDILGKEVAILVNGEQTAGSHSIVFDASHLSSGTYIYRLSAGDKIQVKKMVLLK